MLDIIIARTVVQASLLRFYKAAEGLKSIVESLLDVCRFFFLFAHIAFDQQPEIIAGE